MDEEDEVEDEEEMDDAMHNAGPSAPRGILWQAQRRQRRSAVRENELVWLETMHGDTTATAAREAEELTAVKVERVDTSPTYR
jgi:hypothetical protein